MYAELHGDMEKRRIKSLCDNKRYVEYGTGIYSISGDGRKTPWVYWSDKLNRYVFTRGMRAQPYFKPAVEMAAKHFERELNKLG